MNARNRFAAWVVIGGVMLLPIAASAQVYKWVDERGQVNYGSKPPPNARNVTRVDENSGRVSTITMPKPGADADERAARERAERAERALEDERRAQQMRAQTDAEGYRLWRERCIADRRVDCDDPYRGAMEDRGYGYYPYYPPRVRPPIGQVPPGVRPGPVVPGAGGVVGPYVPSPPSGIGVVPGPGGVGATYGQVPPGGQVIGPGVGGVGVQYYPAAPGVNPPPASQRPAARPEPR